MKTLLILALLAGLGYGVYYFLVQVNKETDGRGGALKAGENALKDVDNTGTK